MKNFNFYRFATCLFFISSTFFSCENEQLNEEPIIPSELLSSSNILEVPLATEQGSIKEASLSSKSPYQTETSANYLDPWKTQNVPAIFGIIDVSGSHSKLIGTLPWSNIAESHVQGAVEFENRHGRWVIITHNRKGYSRGFFSIYEKISATEYVLKQSYYTAYENYNHPAGIQFSGQIMAISVENSSYTKSYIAFYDMADYDGSSGIGLFSDATIWQNDRASGSLAFASFLKNGIRHWYILSGDNGEFTGYLSSDIRKASSAAMVMNKFKGQDCAGMGIAVQSNYSASDTEKLFPIMFYSEGVGSYTDYVHLFEISSNLGSISSLNKKQITTYHYDICCVAGVHCRWGTGLAVKRNPHPDFSYVVTQRNEVSSKIHINEF